MPNRKRRLTEAELEQIQGWMDGASMENKPSIRQIAKAYGVNRPSVIKSLGGWKGIQRGRPDKPPKSKFVLGESPVIIEPFTTKDD